MNKKLLICNLQSSSIFVTAFCHFVVLFGFRKTHFFKAQPTEFFGVLLGLELYWVFGFFYLNKQLGNLLVDLAH